MPPKIRLAIRGFVDGKVIFEDLINADESQVDELLPALAEKHATAMAEHRLHMIEIEFIDEPDPLKRYFRFGPDPRGMVQPIEVEFDAACPMCGGAGELCTVCGYPPVLCNCKEPKRHFCGMCQGVGDA